MENKDISIMSDADILQYAKTLKNDISKYNNLQYAKKIQLNSLYGCTGNKYFRFFHPDYAGAITNTGQIVIRWAEKHINEFLNASFKTNEDYVIAVDTDSIYLDMSGVVKAKYGTDKPDVPKSEVVDMLDKFGSQIIEKKLAEFYEDFREYTNAFENTMNMDREVIADKGVWTAKKRYVLNVHDNEGVRYAEPQLKMMGIESIRSSTPMICRDGIKDTLKLMMQSDMTSTQNFIRKFKDEFFKRDFEEIATPSSCNNMELYSDPVSIYKKGTPIAVKGALIYNHLLDKLNLTNKYPKAMSGDKVKYCYLKQPNMGFNEVIAVPETLPPEFKMHDKIDFKKQYEAKFNKPLTTIFSTFGWTTEKRNTLFGQSC